MPELSILIFYNIVNRHSWMFGMSILIHTILLNQLSALSIRVDQSIVTFETQAQKHFQYRRATYALIYHYLVHAGM